MTLGPWVSILVVNTIKLSSITAFRKKESDKCLAPHRLEILYFKKICLSETIVWFDFIIEFCQRPA